MYIGQSDLVNPVSSFSQLALESHWVKTCFFLACIGSVTITNYIEIIESIMPKPVYLLTVQEAHKEYKSLNDQIHAKYEQLDSGEFGVVGTPAFKDEACELANIFAYASQLCQKTEPATSKGIVQAHVLQALKTLFESKLVH